MNSSIPLEHKNWEHSMKEGEIVIPLKEDEFDKSWIFFFKW